MDTFELPIREVLGPYSIETWHDTSRGMSVYRTEVCSSGARVGGDLWSIIASDPQRALKNHASGRIQAADVAIDSWLRRNERSEMPPEIKMAAKILHMTAADVSDMCSREPHASADHRRRLAAERIAEIELDEGSPHEPAAKRTGEAAGTSRRTVNQQLSRCLEIAYRAHAGQVDKFGEPYIHHPLRVMGSLEGDDAQCAAILHDVVEKSKEWTLEALRSAGVRERVVEAVDHLTRREDEAEDDYLDRVMQDPLARQVKVADVQDNSAPHRLALLPAKKAEELATKYEHALDRLTSLPKV